MNGRCVCNANADYVIKLVVKRKAANADETYFSFFGEKSWEICDKHFTRLVSQLLRPNEMKKWLHELEKPEYKPIGEWQE